jgi:hypothetical protein
MRVRDAKVASIFSESCITNRAIRSAETTITAAVEHWNKIVLHLQKHLTGENSDFSKFENIVGVVCTPFVVYTSDITSLTQIFDNLRPVSSLEELIRWMDPEIA